MEITRFQAADEESVRRLHRALYEPLQLASFQWQPDQTTEGARALFSAVAEPARFSLMKLGAEYVGYTSARNGMVTTAVHPEYRGLGIARMTFGSGANTASFTGTNNPPLTSNDELTDVLTAAQKSTRAYQQIFRDLTATETRTTELFARDGQPDGKRITVADLIVYQSRFDERVIYECRLFSAIGGKPVNIGEKALRNFFEKAARAKTPEQERELFREKNKEHFYHFYFFHRTLNPLWMAQAEGADKLEFASAGREQIAGRETVIVAFHQKEATPLKAGELAQRQLSKEFKHGWQRWRGRFWVDAASGQVWRIEQERTLEYADTPTPLVVMREELEFTPSKHGIPVPKRFVADWNFHSWLAKDGARQLARRVRFSDEYGAFQRFTSDGQMQIKR